VWLQSNRYKGANTATARQVRHTRLRWQGILQ
jgi:hypothetical protein